jgi:GNAT superfamily N-acetyltransferase
MRHFPIDRAALRQTGLAWHGEVATLRCHRRMNPAPIVRILAASEQSALACVAPDVFDHAIDSRWATEFFADPRHHLDVALLEGQVIGMASAVHYVHPDKPPELWINEVGVAPAHQGQGLGRQLLHALFDHARALGCAEAWVLTDDRNTAARHLYASVGGAESPVKYFSFALSQGNEHGRGLVP